MARPAGGLCGGAAGPLEAGAASSCHGPWEEHLPGAAWVSPPRSLPQGLRIPLGVVALLAVASCGAPAGGGAQEADTRDEVPAALSPTVTIVPRAEGITPETMGVLVNLRDPQSVAVAAAFVDARGIPPDNVVELDFPAGESTLEPVDFGLLRQQVENAASETVEAWAVTWTFPFRVGCMSITSALAFGYDAQWCHSGAGCGVTAASPLFDHRTRAPHTELGVRPAMMLAAPSVAQAQALIERGVRSDGTRPPGTGYLIKTSDTDRNVRFPMMAEASAEWSHDDTLAVLYYAPAGDIIENVTDVMFYFTGLTHVGGLQTLAFPPGAVADHLTSFGGDLHGVGQMTALAWLEAGATASFGTVREPCNYTQKFPDPRLLLRYYVHGETVIEAYWKAVAWPGEGLFVGEPLAKPWGAEVVTFSAAQGLRIVTTALWPGESWSLEASDGSEEGSWEEVAAGEAASHHGTTTIVVNPAPQEAYRLVYGAKAAP